MRIDCRPYDPEIQKRAGGANRKNPRTANAFLFIAPRIYRQDCTDERERYELVFLDARERYRRRDGEAPRSAVDRQNETRCDWRDERQLVKIADRHSAQRGIARR